MFTTIIHPIRKAFGLSIHEYCILDHLSRRCGLVRGNGWCDRSRKEFCNDLDLAESTVFRALKKLEEIGLVEQHPTTRQIRTTDNYNELVADSSNWSIDLTVNSETVLHTEAHPNLTGQKDWSPVKKTDQVPEGAFNLTGQKDRLPKKKKDGENEEKEEKKVIQRKEEREAREGERRHVVVEEVKSVREGGDLAPAFQKTQKGFVTPTLEEIKAHLKTRKYSPVNAEIFFEYYQTAGWVDVKGTPVRNWKLRILNWERNEYAKHPELRRVNETSDQYFERTTGRKITYSTPKAEELAYPSTPVAATPPPQDGPKKPYDPDDIFFA